MIPPSSRKGVLHYFSDSICIERGKMGEKGVRRTLLKIYIYGDTSCFLQRGSPIKRQGPTVFYIYIYKLYIYIYTVLTVFPPGGFIPIKINPANKTSLFPIPWSRIDDGRSFLGSNEYGRGGTSMLVKGGKYIYLYLQKKSSLI